MQSFICTFSLTQLYINSFTCTTTFQIPVFSFVRISLLFCTCTLSLWLFHIHSITSILSLPFFHVHAYPSIPIPTLSPFVRIPLLWAVSFQGQHCGIKRFHSFLLLTNGYHGNKTASRGYRLVICFNKMLKGVSWNIVNKKLIGWQKIAYSTTFTLQILCSSFVFSVERVIVYSIKYIV